MMPSASLGLWAACIAAELLLYLTMNSWYFRAIARFGVLMEPATSLPPDGGTSGPFWRQSFSNNTLLVRFWPVPGLRRPSLLPLRIEYERIGNVWHRTCLWGLPPISGLALGFGLSTLLDFYIGDKLSLGRVLFAVLGPMFILVGTKVSFGTTIREFAASVGGGEDDPFVS